MSKEVKYYNIISFLPAQQRNYLISFSYNSSIPFCLLEVKKRLDTRLSEIWLEFSDGLMWSQELELMILLDPFCDLFIYFLKHAECVLYVCFMPLVYKMTSIQTLHTRDPPHPSNFWITLGHTLMLCTQQEADSFEIGV